jgi:hypothetical protein
MLQLSDSFCCIDSYDKEECPMACKPCKTKPAPKPAKAPAKKKK